MKILIAEDDQDIRELIILTLQFNGFEVVGAKDGLQAIELARQDAYVLILMDVRMPRMTGYEACRQLRGMEATKDIPMVILSAKGQEAEIQAGRDAGATDYILKPFAPDVLVKKIHEFLQ
jgi:two-component system alkaline phosphatase synthesis response regulator PhoP